MSDEQRLRQLEYEVAKAEKERYTGKDIAWLVFVFVVVTFVAKWIAG